MRKPLQTFVAFFLVLTFVFPTMPLGHKSVEAASIGYEAVDEIVIEDCISLGYAADAFYVEDLVPAAFSAFEAMPASALVGTVVRTWGSQFAISSAEEWSRAQGALMPAGGIEIDVNIGFEADPTALEDYRRDERGALVLADGILTATYESVPFTINSFTHLINSFGADTPDGTWIEVWVRVGRSADDLDTIAWLPTTPSTAAHLLANPHSAANVADGFLTSGRWSPFSQDFQQGVRRTTSTGTIAGGAHQATGSLIVNGDPANVVQYRVTLHRDNAGLESPAVRHVHSTTRNARIDRDSQPKEFPAYEFPAREFNGQSFPGGNTERFPSLASIFNYLESRPIDMDRQGWNRGVGDSSVALSPGVGHGIYMQGFPMRSQQATGPILGGVNCSAVTIGMIINGFLHMEGITTYRPMEEIGLNLFDYQLNGFGNWQFSVAGAGTYGLRAHVEYNDRHATDNDIMMETILRHLLSGHAVGLSLQFSSNPLQPHFISRVDGTTGGHLIVLLGVVQRGGNWYVISYEPWSGSGANANDRVYRELPMQELVNAMRFTGGSSTGTAATHNIIYVVKPGVETGAGQDAPTRFDSYLIQVAPGEFALSTDGTLAGRINIRGMDRGQIGGPNGFVAYTIDPNFNFMGTSISDPHGQSGTKFRYMPLGDTIRFGFDAHISPVQPFTYAQLTDPNFRMYIMMGNGFTHVIDHSRVPALGDLYPELRSPGGEFRVNNSLRNVARHNVELAIGETTIGELRAGLETTMGGSLAIFRAGTAINSIQDFEDALAAAPPDSEYVKAGDFIVIVNANRMLFVIFTLDLYGLWFEKSGINEVVLLDFYDFTRQGSPNFYSWSNQLQGWDGNGEIIYTAYWVASIGGAPTADIPSDATDDQLRSTTTSGLGNFPVRFVEVDSARPGGFEFLPYSTTGEIMPWRGTGGTEAAVRITARINADDTNDPLHNVRRSFYVRFTDAGGFRRNMNLGEYETGALSPSFTWGTFRAPVEGERTYNLIFHSSIARDLPGIDIDGRPLPANPVPFPYTPYENDRPYWTLSRTWDDTAYGSAANNSRVNWFWQPEEGPLQPVPLDAAHGYVFQPGRVYVAVLRLTTAMYPRNLTWLWMPSGAGFDTFVSNIAGLPDPGEDGIESIVFSRGADHILQATITFERLPEASLGFDIFNNGPTGSPSTPNASLADAGIIRMWTQLDGVNTLVPYADLDIEAVLYPSGVDAMEFVRVNNMWENPGYVNLIDVDKAGGAWQTIILTVTLNGQEIKLILDNALYTPPVFGLHMFNNGPAGSPSTPNASLAAAGTIRIWTQLDGVNALVPYADLDVEAVLYPSGVDAMEFVRVNNMWANPGNVNLIDVDKAGGAWQTIILTVTLNGQEIELILDNALYTPPVFGLHMFNNGPAGSPSTPNASLAAAGTIRIWTQLDGVNALVPYADLDVEAVLYPSGADAMEFVRVNNMWANPGNVNLIDINKAGGAWQTIILTAILNGQEIELILDNALFNPVIFGLQAFNNGTDAQVPGLAGTIRIWTQLDGVNALVPYAELNVAATLLDGITSAMEFVRINRIWNNMDYVSLFDVNKDGDWEYINFSATLFGQTVDLLLVNNRFVPAALELEDDYLEYDYLEAEKLAE